MYRQFIYIITPSQVILKGPYLAVAIAHSKWDKKHRTHCAAWNETEKCEAPTTERTCLENQTSLRIDLAVTLPGLRSADRRSETRLESETGPVSPPPPITKLREYYVGLVQRVRQIGALHTNTRD